MPEASGTRYRGEGDMKPTKPLIIAALPVRWTTKDCAECGNIINGPAVRVAFREGTTVYAATFHPHIDEDLEQRPCAPEHPLVRKAIAQWNRRATRSPASHEAAAT